jgi:hypothetical protein
MYVGNPLPMDLPPHAAVVVARYARQPRFPHG